MAECKCLLIPYLDGMICSFCNTTYQFQNEGHKEFLLANYMLKHVL